MNVSQVKYFSTVNGEGVRTAVFVSGCNLHCDGCFNTGAWSFKQGHTLTKSLIDKILDSIDTEYCHGLSILGGEPLDPQNQEGVLLLIDAFKKRFKGTNKTIWLWTGYVYENIPLAPTAAPILANIDYLVDGPFIASKKNLDLAYRGSENQRIINMAKLKDSKKLKVTESAIENDYYDNR